MFNTTHTYKVSPKTRLDKIFPNGLPVNAFVDKGRCAIGGTYSEITNTNRCSLITVPNTSILLSKEADHPEIKIVYCNASYEKVKLMLLERKPGMKIMSTPEGMKKIMDAAAEIGCIDEVYSEWFLLLDEVHTFISESYRPDILIPFNYFWNFRSKSIISATPYIFSDEKFKMLDYHKITFTEKLGTVRLINSTSVVGTLNYILKHTHEFPGNLHIFYNSVTEIANALSRSGIDDCTINCADDNDGQNMKKLGEFERFYVAQPSTATYKKVNFYTCKYFEGWDLFDKDATAIIVTDVHKPHTKIGVSTKCKQAVGRIRENVEKGSNLYQIIHVTNHSNNKTMKHLDQFRSEYLDEANLLIRQNDERIAMYNDQNREIIQDERLFKFTDADKETKKATLNTLKLDQQINEAAKNEIYNHIDYIQQDWEDAYYNVVRENVDIRLDGSTKLQRKSAATQLKEDYQALKAHKLKQQDTMIFSLGKSLEQSIKDTNLLAYKAYQLLDEAKLNELKYNVKKVQAAIIVKENNLAEVKLLRLLNNTFRINNFYTNEEIKNKLQQIYNDLNIRAENGKIKKAIANQISEHGKFEVQVTKRKNQKGKDEHGMVILRPQFALRIVA